MNARTTNHRYSIAVIPGDGIGNEVVPEGIRVVEAAGRKHGIEFTWNHFPWSCETYAKHGYMMPTEKWVLYCRHRAANRRNKGAKYVG